MLRSALLATLSLAALLAACSGGPAPTSRITAPPATAGLPTASPPTQTTAQSVPTPERLWGDWLAHADTLPGIGFVGPRIQLSIDWQDGIAVWLQTYSGSQVLQSQSVAAPAGQIRLVTQDSVSGCKQGELGTYRWHRSDDGLYLTFEAVEDACPARLAAIARTWVHSLGAVNHGGPGVAHFDPAYIQATLPPIRLAMSGPDKAMDIHSFDPADPQIAFIVIQNPVGLAEPCNGASGLRPIEPTRKAFVAYVKELPGFSVSTETTTVGGRDAVHLTTTSDASIDCPGGEITAFRPIDPTADYAWGFIPGEAGSLWIVDMGASTMLIWYGGEGVTPADEAAVIASVRFSETLPTP